jgi:hypothetical protein
MWFLMVMMGGGGESYHGQEQNCEVQRGTYRNDAVNYAPHGRCLR